MRKPRDRRFEALRRSLHQRLRIMAFEIKRHALAEHENKTYECTARTCPSKLAYNERDAMLREIIREFGGRA